MTPEELDGIRDQIQIENARGYPADGECPLLYPGMKCGRRALLEHIDSQAEQLQRLQMIISEPVESFGTPELIEWANGLQKIIADYPESERGELPFVMLMGSHLEKFAKSWNCTAMKQQAEQIKRLEEETGDLLRLAHKQRAALKKLGGMVRARGEMLVEERAMVQLCHDPGKSEEYYHDAAKRQLRAEGVIR